MAEGLAFTIRTPGEAVFDGSTRGIRLPTESGQVGVRPGAEPILLVVEPGLIIINRGDSTQFAATAGGLFECDRRNCVLYTPFAVAGDDEGDVLTALDRALSTPDSELAARRRLGDLEQKILQEVRYREPFPKSIRA